MGLTKRKDSYYVEFPVIDDGKILTLARGVPGAKLKRWTANTKSKQVAEDQESMIKNDLMRGNIKSKKLQRPITFAGWAERYLKLPQVQTLRSFESRKQRVQGLITFFGNSLLTDIAPGDVERFRADRRLKNGKAPTLATVNQDHAVLKHMFSEACRRELLVNNPASRVKIPDPRNERDRVLSQQEWDMLYLEGPTHLKPILLVAYHLGLRYSEIINLTWDRVDLKGGFVTLTAKDTKNKKPRIVPLTPELIGMLREMYKVRYIGQDRIFLRNGQSIRSIRTAFELATRRAGIPDLRFHDLRHCAATNMRRAGVDVMTAMRIIGHTSERMYKRYNTIDEQDLKRAASQINTYLTLAQLEEDQVKHNSAI